MTGTGFTSVSTTFVSISSSTGSVGRLSFISGYNTSNGAQGWWLVAHTGSSTATVIQSGNDTGLTVTFQNSSNILQMKTDSGTVAVSCFDIGL